METIAVYWEPKIRVYGLTTKVDLSLYTIIFPVARLAHWGEFVDSLHTGGGEFELVNLQSVSSTIMQLCLIPTPGESSTVHLKLQAEAQQDEDTRVQVQAPVDLLYLHGPHFQDRYGIVDAALRPLSHAGIPVLAAGCAGTSLYLVVSENRAAEAAACLGDTFVL